MKAHRYFVVCVFVIICATPRWTDAGPLDPENIRPMDAIAASLVRFGQERSATFRELVDVLQDSNVIVYVDVRRDPRYAQSGLLQFMGEAGGVRWLRATIDVGTSRLEIAQTRIIELTAILGHELQHAREVAEARFIGSADDFDRHFRTIGLPTGKNAIDTLAAREAGESVEAEVRGLTAEPFQTRRSHRSLVPSSADVAPADEGSR